MSKNEFLGEWRITEMEQWDKDYIDMEVPGYFTFKKGGTGEFQFGLIRGDIDYEVSNAGGEDRLEFSWEGNEEMDTVSGRGRAILKGPVLNGKIYIHNGDNSWFTAKKLK